MKLRSHRLVIFFLLMPLSMLFAQSPTNYLGIKGPISIQKNVYSLAWSSHPSATYYKQEYLQKGDSLERFKSMVLVEVLSGPSKLQDVIAAKVNELKALKEINPVVQYEVFSNAKTGEYLLDFLLTANAPDGTAVIAERNVYRYKAVAGKEGKTGVLLLGISTRSYGKEITSFLKGLKTTKKVMINGVVQAALPLVTF